MEMATVKMAIAKEPGTRTPLLLVDDCATSRIGRFASGKELSTAKRTIAARYGERNDHAVAALQSRDAATCILHDPHEFMARNVSHGGSPLTHCKWRCVVRGLQSHSQNANPKPGGHE